MRRIAFVLTPPRASKGANAILLVMNEIGKSAGNNISCWERTAKKFQSAPLAQDLTADICVVGGGLAGVTTAYLLARERKNVVLIDDGPLGGGMTGRTTAQLVNAIDDRYFDMEK